MKNRVLFALSALYAVLCVSVPAFAGEPLLLSPQALEPYGLTRAWFNQIDIDAKRSKVLSLLVEGDALFVVSDDAKLHTINAHTGKSLWSRSLGKREMLIQEPAANSRMVAVVNGLELFVLNRKNGKLLMHIALPGASSTACEISENYVYIPMMDGKIVAYPLEDVAGPRLEDGQIDESGKDTDNPFADAAKPAGEQKAQDAPAASEDDEEDPVLANIVKRFAEAKASVMAEAAPPEKETEIQLKKAIGFPLLAQSFGTVIVKPLLASEMLTFNERHRVEKHRETLAWVTPRGYLMAAGINGLSQENLELQYMVDSSAQTFYLGPERIARREWTNDKDLASRPARNQCVPPLYISDKGEDARMQSMVVAGGKSGYVFAIRSRTGEVMWQFPTNGPIEQQIAVIGLDVYCPVVPGGMYALDLKAGGEKWFAADITQFLAASEHRLYVLDRKKNLVILDRLTGNRLSSFDVRRFDRFYFNVETDRIYAVNDTGLIQCLHERQPQTGDEVQVNQPVLPLQHRLNRKQYADILYGGLTPELYWEKDIETDKAEAGEETEEKAEPAEEPVAEADEEK